MSETPTLTALEQLLADFAAEHNFTVVSVGYRSNAASVNWRFEASCHFEDGRPEEIPCASHSGVSIAAALSGMVAEAQAKRAPLEASLINEALPELAA